jgi:rRNA biogenesis protein RRP5
VPYLVTIESGDAKDEKADAASQRVNSVSDLKVGMPVSCKITAIKDSYMSVSVGPHVKGRIHITEVVDDVSREHPFAKFKVGDIVNDARVISLQERNAENALELTHQTTAKNVTVDLSVRPSCVQMPVGSIGSERFSWNNCKKGQQVNGWVHQVTADGLWVHISPSVRGRVFILDVSNDLNILRNLTGHFRPGQGVKLKILRVDPEKQDLDLSIKALFQEKNAAATPQELKAGMVIPGRIARILLNRGLYLQLFSHTYGRAFITDLDDNLIADPLSAFAERVGEVVECFVLGVNERQDGLIDLSLRASRLSRSSSSESNEVTDFKKILPGTTIRGYVKNVNISNKTCFISLNRNIVARVFFKNLSDNFSKDPVASFPIGKLVEGRVISVDAKNQRVEMTLRKKEVKEKRTFSDIAVGEKVKGYIKRIEKFGIFITIKDASVVGLCHVSEVLDEKTNLSEDDLKRMFSPGDYVKAVVLRKNDEKKQLSLSFKPSHFENDADSEDDEEVAEEADASDDDAMSEDDASNASDEMDVDEDGSDSEDGLTAPDGARVFLPDDGSSDDELPVVSDDEVDNDEDSDSESEPAPINTKKRKNTADDEETKPKKRKIDEESVLAQLELPKPSLSGKPTPMTRDEPASPVKHLGTLVSGADEAALQDLASLDSDEDDSEEDQADQKRALDSDGSDDEAAREREVEQREKQLLDSEAPETPQDFERLLLSDSNNSMLWIRYMAHWLSQNDVAKARDVAEKALQRINIREQKEKRNVWIALLNLEHNYGTKESLGTAFKRAAAHNDTKDMHLELIKIYTRAKEFKAADEIFQTLIRRFKGSKAVWITYGTFRFQQGELDEARALLDRSLKSLPRRKHLAVISKFAQLEFKHGSPERGRTIFENILATYPKRVDIWSIYLDMEMRTELREKIRNLFDRAVSLNLSSKKMKFFFKRYLNFEKQYGTPETVESVKQKAQDYVAKKTATE